ncbi:hypothetical protein JOC93_001310 [Priestia taiwanensis]|nr:hypothetical protein [Priestia taiwanensis]
MKVISSPVSTSSTSPKDNIVLVIPPNINVTITAHTAT